MTDQQTETKSQNTSSDFEDFKMPDLDAGEANAVIEADDSGAFPQDEPEPGQEIDVETGDSVDTMGREEFWFMFQGAFAAPGQFDSDFEPLAIQSDEEEQGHKAAMVTYDLIAKYLPSWLEGSEKWAEMAAAGLFFLGKAKILAVILAHKRAEKMAEIEGVHPGAAPAPGAEQQEPSGGVSWLKEVS